MKTHHRFPRALVFGILMLELLLVLGGCAQTGGLSHAERRPSIDPDSLFVDVNDAFTMGDFPRAEKLARRLIEADPSFDRIDEVYITAARASAATGNGVQAAKYALVVVDEYPLSPFHEEALFIAADADRELGRYYDSANLLLKLLSSPVDQETQARALAALRSLAHDQLGVDELARLVKAYPSSPLAGEMSLALAKREFARGNYDAAYTLLAQLLYEFPQHRRAPEVRQLLEMAASRRDNPDQRLDYVEPNKIGMILPVTGNFSRYGRYFEQGVNLALEEYNNSHETPVSLVRADSRGNPVDAVGAVRKLIVDEGVVAVLGSVLAVPSVAAAVECNASHVPILSPVPTAQRIDDVGPWVFQTKVSSEIEVSAIARVAREDLRLERFAVLAPSTPEKQELAGFFVQEILSRGGQVVAQETYDEGDSDFREQLEAIRAASPEALFIPGDPEELILMLPQINFYDLQIQLFGLSNWNSEKLLRLSQRELEGAIFPGEALYGKNRESYQHFLEGYRAQYGGDVHPVATAGYFGMRLLLEALDSGAVDRTQVRDYLDQTLNSTAERRMAQSNSLSILNVRSGEVREFTTSLRHP